MVNIYEKIKDHVERTADKFFVFSLSVCEIFYDEDECYENVLDLFDFSGEKYQGSLFTNNKIKKRKLSLPCSI